MSKSFGYAFILIILLIMFVCFGFAQVTSVSDDSSPSVGKLSFKTSTQSSAKQQCRAIGAQKGYSSKQVAISGGVCKNSFPIKLGTVTDSVGTANCCAARKTLTNEERNTIAIGVGAFRYEFHRLCVPSCSKIVNTCYLRTDSTCKSNYYANGAQCCSTTPTCPKGSSKNSSGLCCVDNPPCPSSYYSIGRGLWGCSSTAMTCLRPKR